MALESRSRMVSFRLTEQEYERFRRECRSRGLRNVSELVRAAVTQLVDTPVPSHFETPDLRCRLAQIEIYLSEIASHFRGIGIQQNNGNSHLVKPAHLGQSGSGQ